MSNKNKIFILGIINIILVLLFIFLGMNGDNYEYLLYRRVPKIIAIIITGSSIGVSTLIFQTVSNNRIITPSVLGLDALYILIQTFIIFIFSSKSIFILNKNINFLLSTGMMIIFSGILYKTLFRKNKSDIMKLLLVGIVLSNLFSSISSFMQMMIDPNEFLHIQDSMFASFNNVNINILKISGFIFIVSTLFCIKYIKVLDVMSLGRDESINLGIDHSRLTEKLLLVVSVLVSVSTALVGPITFLGLLVVNLSRQFLNTFRHKELMISSVLISLIALIGGQLIVERIFNFGTPISVIINFIGGLYFMYLLLKENVK